MSTILTEIDLDRLHERRRRASKVVLRLETGEVLAEGHEPLWRETDVRRTPATWRPHRSTFYTTAYTTAAIVRLGLYTREEIEAYVAEEMTP